MYCGFSRIRHETHFILPYYWQTCHQKWARNREFKVEDSCILSKSLWEMEIRSNFSSAKYETTYSLSIPTLLDKSKPGQAQKLIICFSANLLFHSSLHFGGLQSVLSRVLLHDSTDVSWSRLLGLIFIPQHRHCHKDS